MRTATCEFHTARVSLTEYIHSALQKPRSGDVIIGHANSPSYLLHRKFQCFISSCHNLILKTPRSCYRNLLQIIRRYLKMVGYVGYWSVDQIFDETLSHLFTTRHRNLRATRITEFRLLRFIRVQLFPDRLFSTFSPFHAHSLKRLQELERYTSSKLFLIHLSSFVTTHTVACIFYVFRSHMRAYCTISCTRLEVPAENVRGKGICKKSFNYAK